MNPEFITRVVGLVQKTNDRVVLADPSSGKAVVVMDLDSYERLMSRLKKWRTPLLFNRPANRLRCPGRARPKNSLQ